MSDQIWGRRMLSKLMRTSSDSGAERYRRAMLTAMMNVLSQIVQLATGLISVPLALSYVGAERFGIWMTLSTALAFITFTDLGVGIGVQDRMSRYLGQDDRASARSAFYGAFLFVTFLFVLMMLASDFLVPKIDLAALFSLKSKEAMDEILPTTMMVVFCLGLGLVSGIVQRAFNALQEGFWVALIQAVARVCSLVLLFVVVHLKMGLPALVFVVGGLSSAALLLFGFPILVLRHRWLCFRSIADSLSWPILRDVLRIGSLGLGAAIAIYFVNNSAPVIMARTYGAEGVADYAVLLKLVSVPGLLLTYLVLPLWPAITEAKVRNDNAWIAQAYRKCGYLTLGLSLVSVAVLIPFGQKIIHLWTNNTQVVPEFDLILACAAFMVLGYWNTLTSIILNGLSRFKGQATYGLLLAVVFASFAALIPASSSKAMIVWVIGGGYLLRCVLMQMEVSRCLKVQKAA